MANTTAVGQVLATSLHFLKAKNASETEVCVFGEFPRRAAGRMDAGSESACWHFHFQSVVTFISPDEQLHLLVRCGLNVI
jgi:hypothetical protein